MNIRKLEEVVVKLLIPTSIMGTFVILPAVGLIYTYLRSNVSIWAWILSGYFAFIVALVCALFAKIILKDLY